MLVQLASGGTAIVVVVADGDELRLEEKVKALGTEGKAREGGCGGWLGTENKVEVAMGFGGDLDWEES